MAASARGIQSIEVSGRILDALVMACRPMMLKDIAQVASLAPAQCHAYLTSMRHVGLVEQEMDSGLYRMGPFAMRLGIGWLRSAPVAKVAAARLKLLTEEIGFMSLIAVWGVSGPTVVHINDGVAPAALNLRQGTLFSVTGTATGRVFATFGKSEEIKERIAYELNEPGNSQWLGSPPTRSDLKRELNFTKSAGYAVAIESPVPGTNAIAVPVFGCDDRLALVATLVGPADKLSTEADSVAVQRLLATRDVIADDVIKPGTSHKTRA